jgi:hypothetical protein
VLIVLLSTESVCDVSEVDQERGSPHSDLCSVAHLILHYGGSADEREAVLLY